MKKLLLFCMMFISVQCYAGSDVLSKCMEKIEQNDKLWNQPLFDKKNVAGVLAIGATAVALYPAEIEKIPQVMVLGGPYIL